MTPLRCFKRRLKSTCSVAIYFHWKRFTLIHASKKEKFLAVLWVIIGIWANELGRSRREEINFMLRHETKFNAEHIAKLSHSARTNIQRQEKRNKNFCNYEYSSRRFGVCRSSAQVLHKKQFQFWYNCASHKSKINFESLDSFEW